MLLQLCTLEKYHSFYFILLVYVSRTLKLILLSPMHARSNVGTWPQLGSGSHDHSPAYEVSDKQYKETRAMGDGDAARFMILGIRHYGQLTQQQENSLVDRSE